ncbi:MAG: response regulator transcription factor [Deltaproteobacteria bacterium]|nr:response regulator transcription factor [Deltaproteobacteria bacterium]
MQKLLESDPELEFVGSVGTAAEAIDYLAAVPVDLVVVDLSLPDLSGLEVISRLHSGDANRRLIAMSGAHATIYAQRAIARGAAGFVGRGASADDLLAAMHQALRGELAVGASTTAALVHRALGYRDAAHSDGVATLTPRELEVFEHIGQGLGTVQIAQRLGISHKTVETHRSNMKAKLGVGNGRALVRLAIEWQVKGDG